jgi:hypothetical protein
MSGPYYSNTEEIKEATAFGIGDGDRGFQTFDNTDPEVRLKRKGSGIIDVLKDFSWSASPVNSGVLNDIPRVFLTERAIKMNSVAAGALYFLAGGSTDNINSTTETKLTKIYGIEAGSSLLAAAFNNLNKLRDTIGQQIQSSSDRGLIKGSKYLNSYLGIYLTEETGFNYVLPYFEKGLFSAKNNFSSNVQTQSVLAGKIDFAQKAVSTLAGSLNITQPGSYIERPKHFHFPDTGKQVTITFPLLNTIQKTNILPYQQNYELLWMLTYQNKPYRTSFSRFLPPKIYTLTIPGQEFFPYCYISNMQIEFVGNKRVLPVTLPTGTQVESPIPEAYNVSITFTSLIGDIGNNMVSPGFANRINSSVR